MFSNVLTEQLALCVRIRNLGAVTTDMLYDGGFFLFLFR